MSQTVVTIDVGGTGANNASDARINLGAVNVAGDVVTGNLNVAATLITQNVIPNANVIYDLGTNTARFKDLWLSNSTIHLGEATISANGSTLVVPAMETSAGMNVEAEIAAAYAQANAAIAAANASNLLSGGLITGTLNVSQDIIVGGNVYLEGNTTYINVATYSVSDPLIYLASNNDLTDSVDIGFMGGKNTSGTYAHTGLARDATDGKWKLFDGLAEEGHVGNVVDFANTYLATLVANVEANTLSVINGVSGNVNFANNTLFINSVNNFVGIGTSGPIGKLHISGEDGIYIDRTNGNPFVFFGVNGDFSNTAAIYGSTDGLIFYAGTSTPERMRINANGSVGIGTTILSTPNGGATLSISQLSHALYAQHRPSNGAGVGQEMFYMFNNSSNAAAVYASVYTEIANSAAGVHSGAMALRVANAGSLTTAIRINNNGNVGIGTTSPGSKLTIQSENGTAHKVLELLTSGGDTTALKVNLARFGTIDASNYADITVNSWWDGGTWQADNASFCGMLYRADINTSLSTTRWIWYSAAAGSAHTFSEKLVVTGEGNMTISGTLTENSSIAIKENIDPISNALDLVSQLSGVTYDRKDGSAKKRAGLIAEQVEKVLPNVVQKDEDGFPSGIQYTNLIAYLVESIKELKAEIDVLKGK